LPEAKAPADVHGEEGGRQVGPGPRVEAPGGVQGSESEAEKVDGEGESPKEREEGEKKKGAQPGNQQAGRREMAGL
jgi:hypothetical protein